METQENCLRETRIAVGTGTNLAKCFYSIFEFFKTFIKFSVGITRRIMFFISLAPRLKKIENNLLMVVINFSINDSLDFYILIFLWINCTVGKQQQSSTEISMAHQACSTSVTSVQNINPFCLCHHYVNTSCLCVLLLYMSIRL